MGALENKWIILENKTAYVPQEIIRMAQRDNNTKRKFLLVNAYQGKHMPVSPAEALALFVQLGQQVAAQYAGRRVMVVGFAETATAIGAAVAAVLGPETRYVHTTREALTGWHNLADFHEEHSHAVNQSLFCQEPEQWLRQAEVVLFVEDEVSTGKTLLNIIGALKQNGWLRADQQLAVASLLNGMEELAVQQFTAAGITLHYLLKLRCAVDLDPYPALEAAELLQPRMLTSVSAPQLVLGKLDCRVGVQMGQYQAACAQLAVQTATLVEQDGAPKGSVLVLGAEEFMYPAILTGAALADRWPQCQVYTHATTRSPIKIALSTNGTEGYPLCSGVRLDSLYEHGRNTYVYNLRPYDTVLILYDSPVYNEQGYVQLYSALKQVGCRKIYGVRWVEQ